METSRKDNVKKIIFFKYDHTFTDGSFTYI